MRILIVVLYLAITQIVTAQNKVCFINSAAVYAVFPDTKKAQDDIENYRLTLEKEYNSLETTLNTNYEKFVADSAKLSPAIKEARRKYLESEIAIFQAKRPENENLLQQKTNELNAELTQKVSAATKKVAIANGYNHILGVDAAIIYPKEDEITDKVKAELGIK